MPTVREARQGMAAVIAALDHALGAVMRPLVDLMPRRLRRAAEQHRAPRRPADRPARRGRLPARHHPLRASSSAGRSAGSTDASLVFVGFGIENVEITGHKETSELAILEKLEIAGSLVAFDVAGAQERIAELPWVARATVRKFYPSTLSVLVEEREPFALWQRKGEGLRHRPARARRS